MRIELALIAGIVFFCCWCAYIIVRINSSVPNPPNPAQVGRDPNQETNRLAMAHLIAMSANNNTNSPGSSTHIVHPYLRVSGHPSTPGSRLYLAGGYSSGQLHPRQARLPEANSPVAAYRLPNGSQPSPTRWRPALIGEHYLAAGGSMPALPTSSGVANPEVNGQQQESSSGLGEEQDSESNSDSDAQEAGGQEDAQTESPDQTDQQQQPEAAGESQQGWPDQNDSEESAEDSGQQDSEPSLSGQQIEERSDGRTYSEDLSSATERDRQGRPIRAHRRHLVNGRPTDTSADFDRVVEEIDEANQQQTEAKAQEAAAKIQGVQGRSATIKPVASSKEQLEGDSGDTEDDNSEEKEEPEPKASHKQHEHRLTESLKSQHWDDDSVVNRASTRPPAAPVTQVNSTKKSHPVQLEAQSSDQSVSSKRGDDMKDLDLAADSDKFPFVNRRRKRQVFDYNEVVPAQNDTANSSLALPVHLVGSPTNGPVIMTAPYGSPDGSAMLEPSVLTAVNHTGEVTVQPAQPIHVVFDSAPLPEPDPLDTRYQAVPEDNQSTSWPNVSALGQAYEGQLFGSQRGSVLTYESPQVANSESKSKSFKKSSKMKKKKKKKKMKKKKSNSMQKYEAAKAHAMKRKKMSKKGRHGKKHHNEKKKLANGYKEFSGSTRGKKSAAGNGQKGAKKGALLYKDKGYKKRGFKRAYQKLESGDHKTYFDEFRDKDQKKKWKNFKDKHHYSDNKKWAGNDKKKFNTYARKELKDKKTKGGVWMEKKSSKSKEGMKYMSSETAHKKRKKKKEKERKDKGKSYYED